MFLEGLIYQRSAFAMARNVEPNAVQTRMTLDSGEIITVGPFKVIEPSGGAELGMVVGIGREAEKPFVFRGSSLHHAQFSLAPVRQEPIGFGAESIDPVA